ncbi:MAG: hypothetical protein K2H17_06205 [Duncaniella sp.]|uniref:hypothetical protein n=1 Tax=Duncaniella sp. TaxID=2518496 RepID=UPI0023CE37C1|nr:hypothetical protein [Duncaniella sp.]MDE5988972.1 hypothetical protein [Duncaniella sp.]
MNNGNINNNNKTAAYRARAVSQVQPSSATPQGVYDIPFSSIIEAWIDCERNKRSSNSCTKFRWHAARDLVELWKEIREGRYKPKASMVFMVTHPVLREVWAGAFRDRVVHHWEHLRYQPIIEQYCIDAGDRSMNCRKGYGSLLAVETFNKAIYDFTEGYTRDDCIIVGGDFANFFMSADKPLIWPLLEELIVWSYDKPDLQVLLYVMHSTMFHRCQDNYFRHSPESMWDKLPHRKSLFYQDGMPIGNLPSQNWMNFVGAIATTYAVYKMKLAGFIIFVDDWRCLVRTREQGKCVIDEFRRFLADELHITLHPDKIYLQHYTKGTKMVGAVIKPPCNKPSQLHYTKSLKKWLMRGLNKGHVVPAKFCKFLTGTLAPKHITPRQPSRGRVYIANRTRGHFISAMIAFNKQGVTHKERVALLEKLRASINSYLGLMCHYNSYNVRRKICLQYILPTWGKYIYFEEEFRKCVIRREYDKIHVIRKKLKSHRYAAKFIRPKWSLD